jgi:hypothetical protein
MVLVFRTGGEIVTEWKWDSQLFGGGTTVVNEPKKVPEASPEEQRAWKLKNDYDEYIYQQAKPMFDIGTAGFYRGAAIAPDYQGMYDNYQNQYQGIQQGMNGLLAGNDLLAKQRQGAMANQINEMTGNFRNWVARSGVSLDGTTAGGALQRLGEGITDAYAKQYNQDLATSSQLLEQARQTALTPVTDAAAIQQAAISVPQNIMALGTGQAQPNSNTWETLYQGRMSLASDPQVIHEPSAFGGIASGIGQAMACFPADVVVDVPGGQIPIQHTPKGMRVITPKSDGGVIIGTDGPRMQPIIRVVAGPYEVETTPSQPFLTTAGMKLPEVGDIAITREGKVMITAVIETGEEKDVYDITIDGENIFYANGFAVEGGF